MPDDTRSSEPSAFERFVELGQHLHGIDLQFRRHGTTWPNLWRAGLYATKNERSEFRLTAYGPTSDAAIENLLLLYEQAKAEQDGAR